MNLNEIFQSIQEFDLNAAVSEISGNGHVLTGTEITVLAVTAVSGLLLCLLGLKIIRIWAALMGLVLGFAGVCTAAAAAGLDGTVALIGGLAAGIILAALGAVLYRAGVFVVVFFSAGFFCIQVINPENQAVLAVCLVIALVAAILSVKFLVIITIPATSVCGGAACGTAVSFLLSVNNGLIRLLLCVVISVAGVLVQLLLESKKQKRKNLEKAAEIREESSAANEVERARAVMEDIDK